MSRRLILPALLLLAAAALPLVAQVINIAPPATEDFGQYVAAHQDDLMPFIDKNAGDIFRLAVPVILGVTGWIVTLTMLVGWGLDVLLSRGFAFFYAPAFADWKRAMIYATGRLFLSFIYFGMMFLSIVVLIGVAGAGPLIVLAILGLILVALAAQIVWILYLFRTNFGITLAFYLAVVVVHVIAATLISQPIMGSRASPEMTNFVDNVVTPRLEAEAQATHAQLMNVTSGRDSAQAKVADCQSQLTQAETDQAHLAREIEEKKNSDIYNFSQIIKARARGELETAREQLASFASKYPGSPLDAQARAQLDAVTAQIAAATAQHKQDEAAAAHAAAVARADLLARAAKGQVTLSEMRAALIGKSRADVSALLGNPSSNASDQWFYTQHMILNPVSGEQTGLTVYFLQGQVQSVDYNRGGP